MVLQSEYGLYLMVLGLLDGQLGGAGRSQVFSHGSHRFVHRAPDVGKLQSGSQPFQEEPECMVRARSVSDSERTAGIWTQKMVDQVGPSFFGGVVWGTLDDSLRQQVVCGQQMD